MVAYNPELKAAMSALLFALTLWHHSAREWGHHSRNAVRASIRRRAAVPPPRLALLQYVSGLT